MENAQLNGWLAQQLRIEEVPRSIWESLRDDDFVRLAEAGGNDEREDLVREARRLYRVWQDGKGRKTSPPGRRVQELPEYFEVELGDYENERAEVLAEAMAREAARRRAVVNFRKEVLGGRLLSAEQARAFVTSPAARFFQRRWFDKWGIPFVGHTSEVVGPYYGQWMKGMKYPALTFMEVDFQPKIDHQVSVHVEPPGITKRVRYASGEALRENEEAVDEEFFLTMEKEDSSVVDVDPGETLLHYPGEDGFGAQTFVWPLSLLDELRYLSANLSGLYRWQEYESVWFILTGETPSFRPLRASASLTTGYHNSPPVWMVRLEASPWVPAEEVERTYRKIQHSILGKDNGKLGSRNLALLHFVSRQADAVGKRPPWKTLHKRWNEIHPEGHGWHYAGKWENFQREFGRAKRAVMCLDHNPPKRRTITELEIRAQHERDERRAAAERLVDELIEYLERD